VIVLAVRWYLRFGLSYRDVEELLAERGIDVDHVTVHRWVQRFAPLLADAARFGQHRIGDRWHVDETYVKVAGRWVYLYRTVDQFGQVIDTYATTRRDSEAARRFFQRARTTTGVVPVEVITDRAPTYPRVLDEMWPAVWHHVERYANNRVEADPRPAETSAAPDARDQDHDRPADTRRRPRFRAEPAPRTLRDRRRPASPDSTRRGVQPTGDDDLRGFPVYQQLRPARRRANATNPGGRCRECVPESTALARRGVPRARRSGCAAVLVDQPAEYVDPVNAPD
jgi:transposase-like protein